MSDPRVKKAGAAKAAAEATAAAAQNRRTKEEQVIAAAAKTLPSRPPEQRAAPPYTQAELVSFRGVTYATPEQEAKACRFFKEEGACPWGGGCRDLHVCEVHRFRAVWRNGADGTETVTASKCMSVVIFADLHAKPNATKHKAAIDKWRVDIFAAREQRNKQRDARRDARVDLLKKKEVAADLEANVLIAEEAQKTVRLRPELRVELALARLKNREAAGAPTSAAGMAAREAIGDGFGGGFGIGGAPSDTNSRKRSRSPNDKDYFEDVDGDNSEGDADDVIN